MGITEIQTAAYENREKTPADGVSDNIPFFFWLKKMGRVKVINGGRTFQEAIRIAQNNYVQRIDPTERIAVGYNQTLTSFEYTPKIIVVPVVINALEKAQVQGDAEYLDLLEERNQIAEDSLNNQMEADAQGDGTGFGGKAFAGVRTYVVDDPTMGTYGGLSRSLYSAIRNTSVNMVSVFGSATDSSNIESRLRKIKNDLVRGTERPELCLAGSAYFSSACDGMSAKQRFTQDQEMYEAGFDNVKIEGMTMCNAGGKVFSGAPRIASDRCYGISKSAFALKMYRGFNFQPLPQRVSFDQLVECSISAGIGQLTSNGTGMSFVAFDS